MNEHANRITQPSVPGLPSDPMILCIGVGGGGGNVVNYIHEKGVKDVLLVAANTDQQALASSKVPLKLLLGPSTTAGLGTGSDPEIGESAAIESKQAIQQLFTKQIKMVILAACMGGGTGSGAAPIIARIAKAKGVVVVGIIIMPFAFEGKKKQDIAEKSSQKLRQYCDTLVIMKNDRLMDSMHQAKKAFSLNYAFKCIDQAFYEGVISIVNPINHPGIVNVDFHDVYKILCGAGTAIMGTGTAEGKDRCIKAIQKALSGPLLPDQEIKSATRVLFSITSGSNKKFQLIELKKTSDYIHTLLDTDDAIMVWGHAYDKNLGNKVRVHIIASGFGNTPNDTPEPIQASPIVPKKASLLSSYAYGYNPRLQAKTLRFRYHRAKIETLKAKIEQWKKEANNPMTVTELDDTDLVSDQEMQDLENTAAYLRYNKNLEHTPPSKPPIEHPWPKEPLE